MADTVEASVENTEPESSSRSYGLLAEYGDPHALLEAARGVRSDGYRRFDTYSPFPIHGMDRAMGLGQSKLGYIVFLSGAFGAFLGWLMQWWMGAVDYPVIISGKPFFALEPSIPIIFETTVLFAALGAVFGMLALNGLPRPHHPIFGSKAFERVTDDGFFLHVESRDVRFDINATADLLGSLGAKQVEVITDE